MAYDDKILRGYQQAMRGATADNKRRLQQQVDGETYAAIVRVAFNILDNLPKEQLGTLAAGLMLAATAFAEGASNARALIERKENTES